MLMSLLSRLVLIVFGTLHPAYKSYKALKSKDYAEQLKLLMYWIVFAFYTAIESFLDAFFFWFPFYYECKILFILWTLSPMTRGGVLVYRKFIHPQLMLKEQLIDEFIERTKQQGHRAFLELVSIVMHYGSNFLVQVTVTGHMFLNTYFNKSNLYEKYAATNLSTKQPVSIDGPKANHGILHETLLNHSEVDITKDIN